MNEPMTQIREVLRTNADGVEDHAHPERVAAVHRRVALVRRRRVAVGSVAAVVVLLGGALAVVLPQRQEPSPADAPSRMVGHDVPRTTTSLGDTYRYTKGYVGNGGRLSVRLPASRTGYLVRMASDGDQGRLMLSEPGLSNEWVTPAGGFGTFHQVATDTATTVKVRQRGARSPGAVALAVYMLSRPASGSYTRAGIIYPPAVATGRLLGAWVGDAGEPSHTLHIADAPAHLDIRHVCGGLPRGTHVMVSTSGGGGGYLEGTDCTGRPEALAGEYGTGGIIQITHPGDIDVNITAVDRRGDPVDIPSNGRLGVGIYAWSAAGSDHGLARHVDSAGHRWLLSQSYVAPKGQSRASATVDGRQPALVSFGSTETSRGTVTAWIGSTEQDRMAGGVRGMTVVANGRDDTVVRLRLRHASPTDQLVIGTYQLDD